MYGKKRRSELEYIQKDASGTYIYIGDHFAWGDSSARRKTLSLLWLKLAVGLASLIAAGIPSTPGARDSFYVILPYIACVVGMVSCAWSLGRLTAAGDPIREYILETAVQRIPVRAAVTAVLSGVTCLGEAIYLVLHASEEGLALPALFLGLMILGGVSALLCRIDVIRLRWNRIPNHRGSTE